MNIFQRWIWGLLGYKCCLPVHHHELNKILDDWHKKISESMRQHNNDTRAQLLEFIKEINK